MKKWIQYGISLLKEAFHWWQKDKAGVWSAALSYYTVFSLGPLLLLIVSILGIIFSKTTIETTIVSAVQKGMGNQASGIITTIFQNTKHPKTANVSAAISFVILLVGASGIFAQLKQMLNFVWGIEQSPRKGLWGIIRDRFLNMSMIASIIFLLLVSFIASTAIGSLGTYMQQFFHVPSQILEGVNFIISLLLTTCLFSLIFKILPDIIFPWKRAWLGSFITALLFTIGKTIIGIYIEHNSTTSSYGAAGSLIALLLWVYYAALILFFGAEVTKVDSIFSGYSVIPSQYGRQVRDVTAYYRNRKERVNRIKEVLSEFTSSFVKETIEQTTKRKTKKTK